TGERRARSVSLFFRSDRSANFILAPFYDPADYIALASLGAREFSGLYISEARGLPCCQPPISSPTRRRPISFSTRITRSIGGNGDPRRWKKRASATGR